jgi:hypothetical protein
MLAASTWFTNPRPKLFQLGVLRFGSDEDGDVRVGVFPERQEIVIGRLGLGGVALAGR